MKDCAVVPALIWIAFLLAMLAALQFVQRNLKFRDWWLQNIRKEFRWGIYIVVFVGWVFLYNVVDMAICD